MYPRLAESDFDTEKEVIVNEIARSEDQPYNLAFRRMMQVYFEGHPLGHDVLGSRESIRNMRIEQMRDYWNRRYAANNLILSVAGNFDWEQLVGLHGPAYGRAVMQRLERRRQLLQPLNLLSKPLTPAP